MTTIIIHFILMLSLVFQGCGNKLKENRDIFNSPVIIITPQNVSKAYPKPKGEYEKLYISPYGTDMKYANLAQIEILSTFQTDKDEILGIITKEARKIGADGVINIKYKAGKKIISDFLAVNRNLMLSVKTYDQMMVTSADIIVFFKEK